MDIYRIPRREVPARVLVDDGRTLEGTLFTTETGAGGRPEDVLHRLNETDEDFVPLLSGGDRVLVNKSGIIWVQLTGGAAREIAGDAATGQRVAVRLALAGGESLAGTLAIVMPLERSRVVDYLNAAGRFVPVFGAGTVTLVQRHHIVMARSCDGPADI